MCHIHFKIFPNEIMKRHTCSRECRYMNGRTKKRCPVCYKEFYVVKHRVICCSIKCAQVYRQKRVTLRCQICYKQFSVKYYARYRKYCSPICHHKAMIKYKIPSKEQLEDLLKRISSRAAAKLYSVPYGTLKDWYRKYNIRPPKIKTKISKSAIL